MPHGFTLSNIQKDGTNLLETSSKLFLLNITEISSGSSLYISSTTNWANIETTNNTTSCSITLSDASSINLPSTLSVTATIDTTGNQSQWDLSVSGLGTNHSLETIVFPELKLKAGGNDHFLLPKYSGKSIPEPFTANINYQLLYPRGWAATMQFLSYYNNDYGIYLGQHDPSASIKTFYVQTENNYLKFYTEIPAENKSITNNNWELPGVFELDLYSGDWYDAALIYKKWVYTYASYRPIMTPERINRQNNIGKMGIWGYFSSNTNYPMSSIQNDMTGFSNFFPGVPVGIHWYRWNYLIEDDNYPDYFPERSGMSNLVHDLQMSGTTIMPYINGRLYDTDLPDFSTNGLPYATKRDNSSTNYYFQNFNGNHFAVMCPTQEPWKDTLADVADQITDRLSCNAIYIDQVCAASPAECMDTNHNHAIGGGHAWRDGYNDMFENIHSTIPSGKFITVEGATDYLVDEVDGFLTEGWTTDHLVPAFQAVYSGKVQLFGTKTGTSTYNMPYFYCALSQAFVNGIQPGRFSLWITEDPDATLARPFIRNLATMRYKLRNFLALGSLQRPIELSGNIPDITSTWYDFGTPVSVTISAIQRGIYKNKDAVAIVFANASMTNTIDFSFSFNGADYGLYGAINMKQITETTNSVIFTSSNNFTNNVQISPMQTMAFLITKRNTLITVR